LPAVSTRLARVALACALALCVSACATAIHPAQRVQRVLFVGNSVTYTNNLPAMFAELANAQGGKDTFAVDLLATGGATLAKLALDPRVQERVASGDYAAVVLQERGGDDFCVLDAADRATPDCQQVVQAHLRLAGLARAHGAVVLYLGTYQFAPGASQALAKAERQLADEMGATHVQVSERLRLARDRDPGLPWLHADGGHPGIATTELMAALVYASLERSTVTPGPVCTTSALYAPNWAHAGLVSHDELLAPASPRRCLLTAAQMQAVIRAAADAPAGS
jgi:hypothetical protein